MKNVVKYIASDIFFVHLFLSPSPSPGRRSIATLDESFLPYGRFSKAFKSRGDSITFLFIFHGSGSLNHCCGTALSQCGMRCCRHMSTSQYPAAITPELLMK